MNGTELMVVEGEMPEGFAHECIFHDDPDSCLQLPCHEGESGVATPKATEASEGLLRAN